MNLAEKMAVSHFLRDYPHDWSFKQIVDHLYYEWDERKDGPVQVAEPFHDSWGEKLGWLVQRQYIQIANQMMGEKN
jgi:hypothetical protein